MMTTARLFRTAVAVLLGFVVNGLVSAGVQAQTTRVGLVERILEQRGKTIPSTQHASILRVDGRQPVRREAPLFFRDVLQVTRRGVLVDLSFVRGDAESRAVIGTTRLDDVGIYEILDTTVAGLSRLQLVVRQGVLVVEHAAGELEAIAAGIRARIFGTTVLFWVDETEDHGVAYLKEGTMYYPDFDMMVTGTDRAWQLRRGERPVSMTLTPELHRHWQREIAQNIRSEWRPPLWQRPAFYIPAAALLVGGTIFILTRGGGDTVQGTVIVTLPTG